jgi:hypothetical protein
LDLTLAGQYIGTLSNYFGTGTPACGQTGTVTAEKTPGTYSYSGRDSSGRSWSGSVAITSGQCSRIELQGGSAPPAASCNWNSASQCVDRSAVLGTRCGSPTSLEVKVRNACTTNIKFVVSIQRSNGTWNSLPDGTFDTGLRPNESTTWYECNSSNRYRVYSMPIQDFLRNRCSYPEE